MKRNLVHYLLVIIALLERLAHRLEPTFKPHVRWTGFRRSAMRNCVFIDQRPVQLGTVGEFDQLTLR